LTSIELLLNPMLGHVFAYRIATLILITLACLTHYEVTSLLIRQPRIGSHRNDVRNDHWLVSTTEPSHPLTLIEKPSHNVITSIASETKNQNEFTNQSKSTASNSNGALPRYIAAKAIMPRQLNKKESTSSIAFAVDRLESNVQYNDLSPRDRSFARLLVTTTERRLGQINAVLSHCETIKKANTSPKRTNTVDTFVNAVLRIGAVQILFLNTPSHAAVKETVDTLRLSKDIHIPQPKINYVNAILRRLSKEGQQLLPNTTDITNNAAPWLIQEWQKSWGDIATRRIVAAAMEENPRCLTVNVQRPDEGRISLSPQEVLDQITNVASLFEDAEILPQGSIRINHPPPGPISTWPLYQEGKWWCQDPAATIPAMALYQALSCGGTKSVHTMHVIDLCAAPGGKTAQLSNYNFASVTAIEISSKRCDRLIENMKRLRMNWNIIVTDGCDFVPNKLVDAVLVDVPCTATGTGSKRPDVLRRDPDLTDLLDIQQKLVRHVADSVVKVGGIIVYATCSLLKQESEDQVVTLLSRTDSNVSLQTLPFLKGEIPGFDDAIDSNGWIRVLPGALQGSLGQCDGFFVARLQRIS
jgi:16S rRNA (cytosine967-C5)-methyltransferase